MADSKSPLEYDCIYHIYNHAVGSENLFETDRNYLFFLSRMDKYLIDDIEIIAYCLIPNHFHLLIRVLTADQKIAARKFSHCFNSYAQAINKERKRMGSLFANRFKRKIVSTDEYFKYLMLYIHHNPIKHGLVSDLLCWSYSSYFDYIHPKGSKRNYVTEYFDDIDNFINTLRGFKPS